MNQILETALRTYVSPTRDNWASLLHPLSLSYNNIPHSTTGFAPAFLLHGYHPTTPSSFLHPPSGSVTRPVSLLGDVPTTRSIEPGQEVPTVESEKAAQFLQEFETYRSQARQSLQFAQVAQQRLYNSGQLITEFEEGDLVLVNPHSLGLLRTETGHSKKLSMKYDGPFEVIQKLSPVTYRLWMPASYGLHPILNIAHLESYSITDPAFGPRPTKSLSCADFKELPEYEVERILGERWHKARNGRRVQELLTRFAGYDTSYDEWLSQRHLRNAPEILREWDLRKPVRSN